MSVLPLRGDEGNEMGGKAKGGGEGEKAEGVRTRDCRTAVQCPKRVVQIAAVLTRNPLFIALSSKNMNEIKNM
jgi:hypothetical protein